MKSIIGYEDYKISSSGFVYSIKNNKLLKNNLDTKGYLYVNLSKNGRAKLFHIHRLVAMAFIPNPLNKPEINHIDGNKSNNNVNNLEWCSHKENMQHARKNNLISQKGIKKSVNAMINATKKPIYQINNGIIVNKFESISQAYRKTKISHICDVLKGKRQYAGGYEWKYMN